MSVFSHFKGVNLNEDQTAALKALEFFLQDPHLQVFILKGYAGTGKTFLMQGVAKWLQALDKNVLFTAPTGRAAKVLQNKSGQNAQTIHRAIYALHAVAEEGAAAFKLVNRDEAPDKSWVLVVDEASMLGDAAGPNGSLQFGSGQLLRDYIHFADFEHFPETKMIFVGDDAQLPPVNMPFSPALSIDYLKRHFAIGVSGWTLRQVVRQNTDSMLHQSAQAIRTLLENPSGLPPKLPIKPGDGLRTVSIERMLEKYFELSPNKPSFQQIILAHSNQEVRFYNQEVRKRYFPNTEGPLQTGDILVMGHNAYHLDPPLHNGELVRVEKAGKCEILELKAPRGKIKAEGEPMLTFTEAEIRGVFRFREVEISFKSAEGAQHRLQVILLDDWIEGDKTTLSFAAQYLLRRFAFDRFYQANRRLYATDKALYEQARSVYCASDPYLNALRCRYGYALTCHKAQGGEWKYVFVDMRARMAKNSSDYYRWAYTAITRAKKCVWVAFASQNNKPPHKIHSKRF